jgi:hypothetical protein
VRGLHRPHRLKATERVCGLRIRNGPGAPQSGLAVSHDELRAQAERNVGRAYDPRGNVRQQTVTGGPSGGRQLAARERVTRRCSDPNVQGAADPLEPIASPQDLAASIPGARLFSSRAWRTFSRQSWHRYSTRRCSRSAPDTPELAGDVYVSRGSTRRLASRLSTDADNCSRLSSRIAPGPPTNTAPLCTTNGGCEQIAGHLCVLQAEVTRPSEPANGFQCAR